MRGFATLLRLELTLQVRSFLYPATVVSTALICAFVLLLPVRPLSPHLAACFVFMDPATIGLSFVGAMVLMEKAQGTVAALGVTPLRPAAYVAAKTVSLTLVTLASGLVVVWVATRGAFDLPRQLLALTLCSTVAVLVGLACVARAASMNQLVVTLLWVSTAFYLPLLSHFGLLPDAMAPLLTPIPSYAMLVVLTAAVARESVSVPAQLAAALYLGAWVWVGWRWTLREFEHAIVTEGR
jgi:ABC-type Na+ efflux pump permease subunit